MATATFLLSQVCYLYGFLPPLSSQQIIFPSEMVTDDMRWQLITTRKQELQFLNLHYNKSQAKYTCKLFKKGKSRKYLYLWSNFKSDRRKLNACACYGTFVLLTPFVAISNDSDFIRPLVVTNKRHPSTTVKSKTVNPLQLANDASLQMEYTSGCCAEWWRGSYQWVVLYAKLPNVTAR